MTPVGKALWFIERHLAEAIGLDAVAAAAGVSRHHLARAFFYATGSSVMRYVRGRRLSEAARRLEAGAPDILDLALAWGYGSHEAFTRAFRDRFGTTPEAVRDHGPPADLDLQEPLSMSSSIEPAAQSPRRVVRPALIVAGLAMRIEPGRIAAIPALWQRATPWFGHLPGEVPGAAYGVCDVADETGAFDYLAGVEVRDVDAVPRELAVLKLAPALYAVFRHEGHIAAVSRTFAAAFDRWLPAAGLEPLPAPCFERYDAGFDPATGLGGCEIWIAVAG